MELFNKVTAGRLALPEKVRVNLLALGDVGSTLLLGLRLMGGDVISSMGICDVRENAALRWEFELNQIQPPSGAALPPVEIISPEQLFDGDVFLFCASRMVPDTSVTGGDVRMAQYGLNRELAASYARMARDRGYQGLFCVVSDPVDPLCRAVLRAGGGPDGTGLRPCQVRGFGLGVMHARALYFARKDPRFAAYLTEGRAFGPHGEDLVLANSIGRYDDALSRELTERVAHANLEMRKLGFKPYVAPALSSGALSLLAGWFGPDTVLHMATSSITPPASVSDGSAAIAVIGGADGPTAIFVTSFYDAQALWGLAVKVFSNVVVVVLNYVFSKLIVFKRK